MVLLGLAWCCNIYVHSLIPRCLPKERTLMSSTHWISWRTGIVVNNIILRIKFYCRIIIQYYCNLNLSISFSEFLEKLKFGIGDGNLQ